MVGSSTRTVVYSVRLPNDISTHLKAEAHLRGRKPAYLILMAVEEWLQRQVLPQKEKAT